MRLRCVLGLQTHLRCVCDAFWGCKHISDAFAMLFGAANTSQMRLRCVLGLQTHLRCVCCSQTRRRRCQAKPAAAAQGKRGVSAARGRKIILDDFRGARATGRETISKSGGSLCEIRWFGEAGAKPPAARAGSTRKISPNASQMRLG